MLIGLKAKILAILTVIGTVIMAAWAYRSGKDKAEKDADEKELKRVEAANKKAEQDATASASANNQAVADANAARKESDDQEKRDIAAVRNADGLRPASDEINAAIDRTNGGV